MAGPRKGVKKTVLSEREKKFAQGVASGMSDKQAALAAGYTESMAANTSQKIWSRPELQTYFVGLMQRAAPPERVVRRISDLIDGKSITTKIRKRTLPATEPKKSSEETEATDVERTETVDAAVSLRAIEMAVQYSEYVPAKPTGVGVAVNISLEEAMRQAGESWEVPSWAVPLEDSVP
jgi:phage terminase small subunit